MIIFKKATELSEYLQNQKSKGKKIGFIPTMGALHQGHLSLVSRSHSENNVSVCSIFINPTQFNNPEDFKLYPVTLDKDIELLVKEGCEVLFLPSVAEIYPPGYQPLHYELGTLETVLEGAFRPGHFQGVCQVMDRLLSIVNPHQLYMGQKDFQQCMVIRALLDQMGKTSLIHLNIMPTLREVDGLAMSSRNIRLQPEQRKKALALHRELRWLLSHLDSGTGYRQLEAMSTERLVKDGFKVDYVSIAQTETLEPAEGQGPDQVVLIAAAIGNVRLIDNMVVNQPIPRA